MGDPRLVASFDASRVDLTSIEGVEHSPDGAPASAAADTTSQRQERQGE
jgi:hypothetical protein